MTYKVIHIYEIPSIGLELKLLSRIPMQTAATTTSDAFLLQKLQDFIHENRWNKLKNIE